MSAHQTTCYNENELLNRDVSRYRPRLFLLGKSQIQYAVLIPGACLIGIHRLVDRKGPGKGLFPEFPPQPALAFLFLRWLFGILKRYRKGVTLKLKLEILFVQPGSHDFELVGVVRLCNIDGNSS